jgi:hypothetical protein
MELASQPGEDTEVSMRRNDGRIDYYRFIKFRRIVGIFIQYEEL